MATKHKKSYKFALRTSAAITLVIGIISGLVLWYSNTLDENLLILLVFSIALFAVSFVIIQSRIEHFIYRRIKKIYDDVSLLESSSFTSKPIVTDMATLTAEIEKFAEDKKIEIDTLKIREEYRKDFLGNIAHELKTPLFTVQGYILTLLDGAMDDKNVREKYLKRANKGVERLIYIIKDLDLITKLEIGDMNLDRADFDIVEVIRNVFELLEIKAAKNKINLMFDMDYSEPIFVNADQEKIQQVITNLSVNSIKYDHTVESSEVRIENLIRNKVIVRMTDSGEEIPE